MCKKRLYVFMAALRSRCAHDIIVSSCGFFFFFFMAAVWNRSGYYIFALWFLVDSGSVVLLAD